MTTHTPGPWEFVPEGVECHTHMGGFRSATGWICSFGDCTTYYPEEGSPPEPADARLIAAAPELLEACKEAVEEMRDSCACPSDDWDFFQKLEAAIAKATGQQA